MPETTKTHKRGVVGVVALSVAIMIGNFACDAPTSAAVAERLAKEAQNTFEYRLKNEYYVSDYKLVKPLVLKYNGKVIRRRDNDLYENLYENGYEYIGETTISTGGRNRDFSVKIFLPEDRRHFHHEWQEK